MTFPKALLALLLLPAATFAQSPADLERIDQRAAEFATATQKPDMTATMAIMPPSLIDSIAAQMNVTRAEYEGQMIQAAEQAADLVTIRKVTINAGQIAWHKAADGMDYALLPTRSVVEVRDAPGLPVASTVIETSQTMAVKEAGEWYLVRLGSARQQDLLREAFPGLMDADLPMPTVVGDSE